MNRMFKECNEIKSLDLSNFNTSKIKLMTEMFYNCQKLEYLNISNFSVKKKEYHPARVFDYIKKNKCKFIANDQILEKLYNS